MIHEIDEAKFRTCQRWTRNMNLRVVLKAVQFFKASCAVFRNEMDTPLLECSDKFHRHRHSEGPSLSPCWHH